MSPAANAGRRSILRPATATTRSICCCRPHARAETPFPVCSFSSQATTGFPTSVSSRSCSSRSGESHILASVCFPFPSAIWYGVISCATCSSHSSTSAAASTAARPDLKTRGRDAEMAANSDASAERESSEGYVSHRFLLHNCKIRSSPHWSVGSCTSGGDVSRVVLHARF